MANIDIGTHYKRFVRYFWDPEPHNDDAASNPIWCLGQKYSSSRTKPQPVTNTTLGERPPAIEHETDNDAVIVSVQSLKEGERVNGHCERANANAPSSEEDLGWPFDFLDDFESRFWFTYRSNFTQIEKTTNGSAPASLTLAVRLRSQFVEQGGFTSDTGWGCMIRSGQCLMANTLSTMTLGRSWRRGSKAKEERRILAMFADEPKAPFSIHRFVEHGAAACGKHPGEWFGPLATSRCIQALLQHDPYLDLKVYVNGDGPDVYEDSLFHLAKRSDGSFAPTLILVGIRLGIERVTPVYWEALKRCLQLPQSMGIAGGRPSASHYFVGVQGDYFFYLDPHHTRQMLPYHSDPNEYTAEEVDSCHTRRLRRLHLDQMDPSMLLAFLIRDEQDWRNWRQEMNNTPGKPILHIGKREPHFQETEERQGAVEEVETLDDEDEGDGELIDLATPQ